MAVKSMFNRLKFWKRTVGQGDDFNSAEYGPEYRLADRLKRYEKYVSQVQSIIMWDNPIVSVGCVLLVNIVFWVLVSLECRFYGIVSCVLLVVTAHEAWTGHVWPEISVPEVPLPSDSTPASAHPSVMAVTKLVTQVSCSLNHALAWMRNLRHHQPGLFCVLCSLACSLLLVIGRTVSGLLLMYCLLMTVLLGPVAVAKWLPPQARSLLAQYASCVQQAFIKYSSTDVSDDEYLPVTSSEDLALLTRASDMRHDTYDSLTNPGSSSDMVSELLMPSHEEDSLASLSDLEPGLMPHDDTDHPQIEFQSGHFNGDSSSDEEAFTRDLVFTDEKERDTPTSFSTLITQAVTSNVLGSVGLLANVIRQRPAVTRQKSSDSDDFEIINSDEIDEDKSS